MSLVHVVPKKDGTTVVKTDDGKLISTRVVTDWRMCNDYRKLNVATRKDHFLFHSLIKCSKGSPNTSSFATLIVIAGSFKSRFILKTKRRPPSHVHTICLHIEGCHLAFVMLLLPFRGP
jgi:hypothetical protein